MSLRRGGVRARGELPARPDRVAVTEPRPGSQRRPTAPQDASDAVGVARKRRRHQLAGGLVAVEEPNLL